MPAPFGARKAGGVKESGLSRWKGSLREPIDCPGYVGKRKSKPSAFQAWLEAPDREVVHDVRWHTPGDPGRSRNGSVVVDEAPADLRAAWSLRGTDRRPMRAPYIAPHGFLGPPLMAAHPSPHWQLEDFAWTHPHPVPLGPPW